MSTNDDHPPSYTHDLELELPPYPPPPPPLAIHRPNTSKPHHHRHHPIKEPSYPPVLPLCLLFLLFILFLTADIPATTNPSSASYRSLHYYNSHSLAFEIVWWLTRIAVSVTTSFGNCILLSFLAQRWGGKVATGSGRGNERARIWGKRVLFCTAFAIFVLAVMAWPIVALFATVLIDPAHVGPVPLAVEKCAELGFETSIEFSWGAAGAEAGAGEVRFSSTSDLNRNLSRKFENWNQNNSFVMDLSPFDDENRNGGARGFKLEPATHARGNTEGMLKMLHNVSISYGSGINSNSSSVEYGYEFRYETPFSEGVVSTGHIAPSSSSSSGHEKISFPDLGPPLHMHTVGDPANSSTTDIKLFDNSKNPVLVMAALGAGGAGGAANGKCGAGGELRMCALWGMQTVIESPKRFETLVVPVGWALERIRKGCSLQRGLGSGGGGERRKGKGDGDR